MDERIEVDHTVVKCDGGGGPLGHPAVYLTIGDTGHVVCPYCSRNFVLKTTAGAASGHGH